METPCCYSSAKPKIHTIKSTFEKEATMMASWWFPDVKHFEGPPVMYLNYYRKKNATFWDCYNFCSVCCPEFQWFMSYPKGTMGQQSRHLLLLVH